jgi:hypothetical protein
MQPRRAGTGPTKFPITNSRRQECWTERGDMGRNRVKAIVGWIIVLGHVSIGAVVLFAKDDVFTPNQKISVLLVLAPVFSIYFVAVVSAGCPVKGRTIARLDMRVCD